MERMDPEVIVDYLATNLFEWVADAMYADVMGEDVIPPEDHNLVYNAICNAIENAPFIALGEYRKGKLKSQSVVTVDFVGVEA